MNRWLEFYKELNYRTRWASILGAVLLAVISAIEVFGTIRAIAVSEIGVKGILSLIGFEEIFPVIILMFAILRSVNLAQKDGAYRSFGSLSWFGILVTVVGIIIVDISVGSLETASDCPTIPNKVCFGIYEMRRASITPLASFGYIALGIFRFAVLSVIACLRQRPKFR